MAVDSPAELPDESKIVEIREPWMTIEIITPTEYYGPIMELVTGRRGIYKSQEYPAPHRVQLNFEIPLSEIIVDFFDELKSRTKGYASLDYQFLEYRAGRTAEAGDPGQRRSRWMRWRPSSTRRMPSTRGSG